MLLFPNCKINIGLYVIEKRSDGFHNLQTVFYPVKGLTDTLEINENKTIKSKTKTKVLFEQNGITLDCNSEENICIKAYNILDKDFNLPPVSMNLHKNIPAGAGLGGGSSDAAFVLKGINKLFSLNLSHDELLNYASKLGSDCAFFIDNKPAFATNKGDILNEINLSLIENYHIFIIKPDIHISTAEAYRNIVPVAPNISLKKLIKLPIQTWKNNIKNDFEKYVFYKYPILENIKNQLYQNGAIYASMSGSGSAIFAFFENIPIMDTSKYSFYWHN
jgi:4-diphosphocytidyl-2-C-methyl-D-erythritol kinase